MSIADGTHVVSRSIITLSTGRTGTMALARYFQECYDEVTAVHEPKPTRHLRVASGRRLEGQRSVEDLRPQLRRARARLLADVKTPIYLESNWYLYGFLDVLRDVYPNPRVVHVVRDPRTLIPSYLNFGTFRFPKSLLVNFVPGWYVRPEQLPDATPDQYWATLSQRERLAFHWKLVNTELNRGRALFGTDYLRVRYEDLFGPDRDAIDALARFVGVPACDRLIAEMRRGRVNASASAKSCPPWEQWHASSRRPVLEACDELMAEYGYELSAADRATLESNAVPAPAAKPTDRPKQTAAPVFIAGCGRSGTTYLRTVLAAHPDVFIPNESLFIADYLRAGDVLPSRLREWLFFNEPQLRTWYDGPTESADDLARAVKRCHETQAASEGARVWGQKTPRFIRHIDRFERAFPGCRWVLVYRDPRAVVASHLKSPRHTYSVAAAARRWARDNESIVRMIESGRTPANVMLVRYEDLILDYEAHLERLFRFVGVDPIGREEVSRLARVAEYRGTGFSVADNNMKHGMDPQPKTIDAWRGQLTEREVRRVEQTCAHGMAALGYEPLPAGAAADLPRRRLDGLRLKWGRLRDVGIVYQYVTAWPRYPAHAILRKTAMRAFALARRLRTDTRTPTQAAHVGPG